MSKNNLGAEWLMHRLLSGGAWVFVGRIIGAPAGFAVNILIARLLSPHDVGVYFLMVSLVLAAVAVAQWGLQIAVVRLVSEALGQGLGGRARGAVFAVLKIGVIGACIVALAVGSIGGRVLTQHFGAPQQLQDAIWYGAAWIVALTLLNLMAETFRGLQDYRLATIFGGPAHSILLLGFLGTVFFIQGKCSLSSVLWLCVVLSAFLVVVAAAAMRRHIARMAGDTRVRVAEVLGLGWPLMITSLAIFFVTQIDLWIIGAYRNSDEVAVYGAAARLVQLVVMPMLIVNAVIPPIISALYAQGKIRQLERIVRTAALLSAVPAFAASLIFVFAAEPILNLVYGHYYQSGAIVLILVSFGQAINIFAGSGAIVLMMTNHQRSIMVISVICGILLVAGGIAVVGEYGAPGVAAVTAAAAVTHAMMTLYWVKRKTGMWTHAGFSQWSNIRMAMSGLRA
ncbi:MAG: oligosaccharide flippase family protein [Pseudomonadota bacterium]